MYSREKRRFAKLVIDQYKTLGRSVGPTRYSQEYRRLRDYAEALFLAIGQKRVTLISEADIQLGIQRLYVPTNHQPQFNYTVKLAVSGLLGLPAPVFNDAFCCSVCHGEYKQQCDGSYLCHGCGYRGRADQHGFPVSLPATLSVRKVRATFHELVRVIRNHGVSEEEAYMLIAYELNVPLPTVHAGLCTSELELRGMLNACQKVLSKLQLERA